MKKLFFLILFFSVSVLAQGVITVQPKSGSVFTCSPSGTQTVSGTVTCTPSGTQTVSGSVTCTPSGTQTVSGTVTCTPSGTQTVSVSNSPTVVQSASSSSIQVQGAPGTVYNAQVSFSTTARRLAVSSSGICNNGGSARRNKLMLQTGATACFVGGSAVTTTNGVALANSTVYSWDLDGSDYYLICSGAVILNVLEGCN